VRWGDAKIAPTARLAAVVSATANYSGLSSFIALLNISADKFQVVAD